MHKNHALMGCHMCTSLSCNKAYIFKPAHFFPCLAIPLLVYEPLILVRSSPPQSPPTFSISASLEFLTHHFSRAFRVFLRCGVLLTSYLNPLRLKHTPENKNRMESAHVSLMDYLFTVISQVFTS